MKRKFIIFSVAVVILILGISAYLLWPKDSQEKKFEKTDYTKLDLTGIDKLMIIAHPDDDILWGGKELIENDYLVVCITCGSDERRVREFESVMGETGDKYVMLGYPDKTKGERDNWDSFYDEIIEDIKNIYALKKWDTVLTHNPDGEYGHIHHKMTDEIVTDNVEHKNLYYFGKYYSKKDLEEKDIDLVLLDEDVLKRKSEILKLYKTQEKTIFDTFGHMLKSENVISYEDWKKEYEEE